MLKCRLIVTQKMCAFNSAPVSAHTNRKIFFKYFFIYFPNIRNTNIYVIILPLLMAIVCSFFSCYLCTFVCIEKNIDICYVYRGREYAREVSASSVIGCWCCFVYIWQMWMKFYIIETYICIYTYMYDHIRTHIVYMSFVYINYI